MRQVGIAVSIVLLFVGRSIATETITKSPFLEQVRNHYQAWDRDADGSLTTNEIEQAVADPHVKGEAAAAAASLRRAIKANREIQSFTLEKLAAAIPYDLRQAEPPSPKFESMYRTALERITAAKREMFASQKPRLETLGQGRLGDCFLLAAVGTCVHGDPQRIVRMLQPKSDGQVEVKFADGRTIRLPPPTDGEIAIGASTRHDGVWANMLEKAIGAVLLERQQTPKHVTPLSIVGVGGSPSTVLTLLTGHRIEKVSCKDLQQPDLDPKVREAKLDEIRAALVKTQQAGRLIVGGTAPIGKQKIVPGLVYNHSYAVLGYDEKTDAVTFWNPFGNKYVPRGPAGLEHGYPTTYGRFDCPLTEAVRWFGSFSCETDEPAM